jgi:hypothetical protein
MAVLVDKMSVEEMAFGPKARDHNSEHLLHNFWSEIILPTDISITEILLTGIWPSQSLVYTEFTSFKYQSIVQQCVMLCRHNVHRGNGILPKGTGPQQRTFTPQLFVRNHFADRHFNNRYLADKHLAITKSCLHRIHIF